MKVRALAPDDAPTLIVLHREALSSAPLAFGASLEDDRGLSLDFVRSSLANIAGAAVLGAFDGEALVGMAGIIRLEKLKSRHRAMIWGMFVTPAARRRGLGGALLDAAIARARSWPGVVQVELSVFETAEEAPRLYRLAGFREWGVELRALQWEGRFVAEHHLVLDLDVLIRDARPGDCDAIREVTLAAYQEYAARMPAVWDGYRRNIVAALADVGPAEQLVVEQEGAIVGTVLLYPPRSIRSPQGDSLEMPWPEVRLLAVVPAARGRGIGAALMQECVRRARRSGARGLSLHTTDVMQAAMRMYERMGFVRAPELDFHPAPGVTVKGYRLDLGAA